MAEKTADLGWGEKVLGEMSPGLKELWDEKERKRAAKSSKPMGDHPAHREYEDAGKAYAHLLEDEFPSAIGRHRVANGKKKAA